MRRDEGADETPAKDSLTQTEKSVTKEAERGARIEGATSAISAAVAAAGTAASVGAITAIGESAAVLSVTLAPVAVALATALLGRELFRSREHPAWAIADEEWSRIVAEHQETET